MTAKSTINRQLEAVGGAGGGPGLERLLVHVLLLAVGLVASLVFLLALGVVSPEQVPLGDQLVKLTAVAYLSPALARPAAAAVALGVGLFSFALFFRRLAPAKSGPAARHILVSDERGFVVVEKRGISTVAVSSVKRVHGVVDARVDVVGGGAAPVRLVIKVWVHAGAELKQAGDLARKRAIEAVEKLVGLDVQDVMVRIEVVPLEELDRVVE